mmetsp:Transcript_2698/g.8321  ORF Transcript_2698/g.8321 Transcript_2698/m.8321 type:complete len:282 (+) Transcript_2698:266-1111(+)
MATTFTTTTTRSCCWWCSASPLKPSRHHHHHHRTSSSGTTTPRRRRRRLKRRAGTTTTTRSAAEGNDEPLKNNDDDAKEGNEKKAEDIPPEDYAIVVELLDCETGEEIQEKADLMAKNGLITAGVVEAARVILDGNIQQGQDEEIILILRAIYDVLLKELQKIRAPYAKKVLEFAQEVMGMFTAEDLESNNEMVLSKVRLVLQEEFDKDEEIGVTREALEKYLGDVLPVMDMQDERLKEQLAACEDPKVQVQMVAQMMQRTKERMQIDHLREVARTFRSEE